MVASIVEPAYALHTAFTSARGGQSSRSTSSRLPRKEFEFMNTPNVLALATALAITSACNRNPTAQPAANAAAMPVTGSALGGGSDRCAEARLIGSPLSMAGDLTTAADDSNARIPVT